MTSASREALVANVVQQCCAAVLVLLPNLLGPIAYAPVVKASILLSFIGIADLGLLQVYGRLTPELRAKGRFREIRRLEAIVLVAGGGLSVVFGLAIGMICLAGGNGFFAAVALALIPVLLYLASVVSTRAVADGDFSAYRRMVVMRSILSLLALPLAFWWSSNGWFAAQWLAALVAVVAVRRELCTYAMSLGRRWGALLLRYVREGIALATISVAWLLLLSSARALSAIGYPEETVSTYGVMNAVYQAGAALLIAVLMPVSVALNRLAPSGIDAVGSHAAISMMRLAPWAGVGACIFVQIELLALPWVFPKFAFDADAIRILGAALTLYPIFVVLGGVLVSLRAYRTYLWSLVCAVSVSVGVALLREGQAAPAIAQLAGIAVLTSLLVLSVYYHAVRSSVVASGLPRAVVVSLSWSALAMIVILNARNG